MRFNCDRWSDHLDARWAASLIWHPWFAWRPVKVGDNDCRWLERVWCKRSVEGWYGTSDSWKYKPLTTPVEDLDRVVS